MNMPTTTLRVLPAGIALRAAHRQRLGEEAATAFDLFATEASPGLYRLSWALGALTVVRRTVSSLQVGQALRWLPSPLQNGLGPIDKPAPDGPYASVRKSEVTTLLTVEEGQWLAESCVAGVVGWHNDEFVEPLPPHSRVRSVTMEWLRSVAPVRARGLRADGDEPLAALNAIAGVVPLAVEGRPRFPAELAAELTTQLWATATRR
jgi:hypothetical protein